MAADLSSLIRQRTSIKAQVTRLLNVVRQAPDLEIPALELRKHRLEEYFEKFSTLQTQIEEIDNSPQTVNDIAPSPSLASSHTTIPKIHIKQFNGNFLDWQDFYDTFRSVVHENESIPIIHHSAASVLNGLTACEENYFVAWELIQKQFNRPRKLIQSHIRGLFELPQVVKDNPASLRALITSAQIYVHTLRALKQPMEWDEMLIYLINSKLDKQTRIAWEHTIDEDVLPKFNELLAFLNKMARDDEPIRLISRDNPATPINKDRFPNRNRFLNRDRFPIRTHSLISTNSLKCPLCTQAHYINQCQENHSVSQCRATTCRKCGSKHYTLLHFENPVRTSTVPDESSIPATVVLTASEGLITEVILATACVTLIAQNNEEHNCRILLDPGSQRNFMTEDLANRLQLPKRNLNLITSGIGRTERRVKYAVEAQFKSNTSNFACKATFLTLPTITNALPSRMINCESMKILNNVKLAEAWFHKPATIDMLLGEYLYYKLLKAQRIRLHNETVVLQNTALGWIVSGEVQNDTEPQQTVTKCFLSTDQLGLQLTKFRQLEEYPRETKMQPEEKLCEDFFQSDDFKATPIYEVLIPSS
ncbi:hypothetical protein ANTQUA_LOCUS9032 [Anthophora quadrimaculata]